VLENGREWLLAHEQSAGTVDASPELSRVFAAHLCRRSFWGQTQILILRLL
jgi:hypothetical protein